MSRVYVTQDKSTWGEGPWQDEPDKVSWTDEATGLPCLAVRNHWGAWCGYVGVDEAHPYFEHDYDEPDVDVHGGLTYAAHCAEGPEKSSICHVPEPGRPDHVWWFGFDCGHSFDLMPGMEAFYRSDALAPELPGLFDGSYKPLAYVQEQVASLARQLKGEQ